MNKTADNQRIGYLDIAKGIGIVLVVLGHCIMIPMWMNHLVFSVHMPLFFILSGYTFHRSTIEDPKGFLRKNVRSLLVPYALTCCIIILVQTVQAAIRGEGVLQAILKWLFSSIYGSGSLPPFFMNTEVSSALESVGIVVTSIGAIWFLLALFFARIGLMLCLKSRFPILWVLVLFFIGYMTAQKIGWFPFSIQAGMCAVLFLYIGYWIREQDLFRWGALHWFLKLFMLGFWIYCIVFCGHLYMVCNIYAEGIIDIVGSICGTFMLVYLAQGIEKKIRVLRYLLTGFGRLSLGIMCAHLIVLDCLTPYDYAASLSEYLRFSYRITEVVLIFAGSALVTAILYAIPWINRKLFPLRFS